MKIKIIVSVAATFVMALGLFTGCGAASTDTTTTKIGRASCRERV